MFNIGPQELLIILIVALIVVGPRRLPEMGRTVGRFLNEFRKLQDEVRDMVRFDLNDDGDAFISPPPATDEHAEGAGDEEEQDADPDEGSTAGLPSHSERVVSIAGDEDEADEAGDDETPPTAAAE